MPDFRPIDPGDLRQQIQLQQPTESQDSFGAVTKTWSPIAGGPVWAKITTLSGRELFAAQRIAAETTHQVTIRYSTAVAAAAPKWRATYGSRVFDINAVLNTDERNIELRLLCKEAV